MESIIVTLDNPKLKQSYDLELPSRLPMYKLAQDIVDTINAENPPVRWSARNAAIIRCRTRQFIPGGETLHSAGVANGESLIFDNAP